MTSPEHILKLVRENNIEVVDFKFVDLPGNWQHLSAPAHLLTEELFEEGLPFDGSSIRASSPMILTKLSSPSSARRAGTHRSSAPASSGSRSTSNSRLLRT